MRLLNFILTSTATPAGGVLTTMHLILLLQSLTLNIPGKIEPYGQYVFYVHRDATLG